MPRIDEREGEQEKHTKQNKKLGFYREAHK